MHVISHVVRSKGNKRSRNRPPKCQELGAALRLLEHPLRGVLLRLGLDSRQGQPNPRSSQLWPRQKHAMPHAEQYLERANFDTCG